MPTGSPASPPRRSNDRVWVAVLVAATLTACTDARAPSAPVFVDRPTGTLEPAQVVRVTDGDTIVVRLREVEERVRYIGIDAPEENDECLGDEASALNAELVEGLPVHLETDVSERDSFGRLLRHVWLEDRAGWTLVSRELVRRGLAEAIVYSPDDRYATVLAGEQRTAQAADRGIWGEC